MVKLDVQVISKEIIKPSSPTPKHLQILPLSLADQLSPFEYIRVLLFYSGDHAAGNGVDKAGILKDSLSKTLTHFYPLAGRIEEPIPSIAGAGAAAVVDCKDQGVDFYQARAEGDIAAVLSSRPVEELHLLLPNTGKRLKYGDTLLAVQLNEFAGDGGSVIGICISHQIADGAAMGMFVNRWSNIAGGGDGSPHPVFHSAAVFPPMNLSTETLFENDVGAIPKNFVISAASLEKLRGSAAYPRDQVPTRVEAVSSLIWRCVARARRGTPASSRKLGATYSVNIRSKMSGKLTENSFGSLFCIVFLVGEAVIAGGEVSDKSSQGALEKSAREAIGNVEEGYIRGLAAAYAAKRAAGESSGVGLGGLDSDFLMFSSWCRFPFYEADFGWGKPAWLSCVHRDTRDAVILADTPDGEGIEVWSCLAKEVAERLEKDEEFLKFASTS